MIVSTLTLVQTENGIAATRTTIGADSNDFEADGTVYFHDRLTPDEALLEAARFILKQPARYGVTRNHKGEKVGA